MATKKKNAEDNESIADNVVSSMFDELGAAGIGNQTDNDLNWDSGFNFFDMCNGCYDVDNEALHIGVGTGRIIQFIGTSGSGKTTLAIQVAWGIVRDIAGASIMFKDMERSLRETRIKNLTGRGFKELGYKFKVNNNSNSTESFKELIDGIHEAKMSRADELNREFTDIAGNTKTCMPPTIVILDSLPQMVPEKLILADGVGSQMTGGQIALANGTVFKQIFSKLGEANILVFIINHITKKIETGSFTTKAALRSLKPDENVAGGSAVRYLTDYLVKIEPNGKLLPEKDWGIQGFSSKLTVIKSRGFPDGKQVDCIYDQVKGWSDTLSNAAMMLARKNEGLTLKGSRLNLEGYDKSFYKKDLLGLYESDEEFRELFDIAAGDSVVNAVPGFSSEEIAERLANVEELEEA